MPSLPRAAQHHKVAAEVRRARHTSERGVPGPPFHLSCSPKMNQCSPTKSHTASSTRFQAGFCSGGGVASGEAAFVAAGFAASAIAAGEVRSRAATRAVRALRGVRGAAPVRAERPAHGGGARSVRAKEHGASSGTHTHAMCSRCLFAATCGGAGGARVRHFSFLWLCAIRCRVHHVQASGTPHLHLLRHLRARARRGLRDARAGAAVR